MSSINNGHNFGVKSVKLMYFFRNVYKKKDYLFFKNRFHALLYEIKRDFLNYQMFPEGD